MTQRTGQEPAIRSPDLPDPCRIGVAEMDHQHLRILNAIQRLQESLQGPYPLATLDARLKQLESLTLEHFQDEEMLMERQGYPHVPAHRSEHENIIEFCHNLLKQYGSPDSPPLVRLAEELRTVFFRHIQGVDMDYARFLAGRP